MKQFLGISFYHIPKSLKQVSNLSCHCCAISRKQFNTEPLIFQAIVLAPTREIAVQGARVALDIAGACMPELKVHTFIGGLAIADDQVKLKKCHLAIGTPG